MYHSGAWRSPPPPTQVWNPGRRAAPAHVVGRYMYVHVGVAVANVHNEPMGTLLQEADTGEVTVCR